MRLKQKHNRKTSGFTLVELIVALAITSIFLVAISSAILFSSNSLQYSRAQFSVSSLANKKMENIRALEYNQIGNVGGNPAGVIPAVENVTLDGRSFQVATTINWVSAGGAANPNADYKEVIVDVYGSGYFSNQKNVQKRVASLFARNSEEMPLTGANLIFQVYRGWGDSSTNHVAVENVLVQAGAISGLTGTDGTKTFLGLTPGTFALDVDPGLLMMKEPGLFPQNTVLANNTTTNVVALVEKPSVLTIAFGNAFGKTPIDFEETVTGTVTLDPAIGPTITANFTGSSATGKIEELGAAFSRMWPVGVHTLTNTTIPGYQLSSYPVWDLDQAKNWDGRFSGPDTTKNIMIMLLKLPVPPPDINADSDTFLEWTNGGSGVIIQKVTKDKENDGIAEKDNKVIPYQFHTKTKDWLKASSGTDKFHATDFYFTDPLAISNNAVLQLMTNRIVFTEDLTFEKNKSDMVLEVMDDAQVTVGSGPDINTADVPEESRNALLTGKQILTSLTGTSYENVKYGELYLYKDVLFDSILLPAGAYYYPDGFSFEASITKSAQNGGLIAR